MLKGHFHTKRWAGYFLVVGGIVMAITGVWQIFGGQAFLDATARAEGTIVTLERERSAKGMAEDHPVVLFTAPESGVTFSFRSRFGVWPSPFAVGENVEVAYDPANPTRARINSFWTIWFMPFLITVFGFACLAAGSHTLRRNQRV